MKQGRRAVLADFKLDRAELAGAVADLGVFVPIAVALIVKNHLSATAVLLPAGLLYVVAAFVYRLPVPVQPLKAFGAIAIAEGLGADDIAAGALTMGVIFLVLGATGLLDLVARGFPRPLIRGVQLTVGLLFLKIAFGLVTDPPEPFTEHAWATPWLVGLTVACVVVALVFRRRSITLVLVGVAAVVIAARTNLHAALGPSALSVPALDASTFIAAFTVLVVPQLPLTFANSCLATADAARSYFGDRAPRVRAGRLATTLGAANLFAGAISGMPVCHGAGGMTAHYSFGARTGGAPLFIGTVLIVVALVLGAGLAGLFAAFPLAILAGLLAVAGLLHIRLLGDLRGMGSWAAALGVGVLGFLTNLSVALGAGLVVWWGVVGLLRLGMRRGA